MFGLGKEATEMLKHALLPGDARLAPFIHKL